MTTFRRILTMRENDSTKRYIFVYFAVKTVNISSIFFMDHSKRKMYREVRSITMKSMFMFHNFILWENSHN